MGEAARAGDHPTVIWRPDPGPQTALIRCPVFEVFYGGARGGGKSDGMLGEWAVHAGRYGESASGLIVRRERTQLYDLIERSRQIYGPIGARLVDNVWRFPDGARLRFAYLERDADADAYQGHSYTRVYVEEVGTFPRPAPIMKLMATLRSGRGVPCGMRLTGNPGGPGHQWVKARYVDPAPLGWQIIPTEFENPFTGEKLSRERVYIPSRVTDNPHLGAEYVANLYLSGSRELVRAWLQGDWDIIAGAYFTEFEAARHVIAPFEIPAHWVRIRAMDWGSAKPFCVLWLAVSDGTVPGIAKGALVVYREWYGWNGEPNVGCKMTAGAVGDGIREREAGEKIDDAVIDPAAFTADGGPSIVERMGKLLWRRADNARVARAGAMGGWDQVRERLVGGEDGPQLVIFATCVHLIRTLPALQHDPHRAEDVDTEGEDHAPDALRYGCMARPFVRRAPGDPPARYPTDLTIDEIIRRARDRRLAES
jgi:hypothetical protein